MITCERISMHCSSWWSLLVCAAVSGGCHLLSKIDDVSYATSATGGAGGSIDAGPTASTSGTATASGTEGGGGASVGSASSGIGGSGGEPGTGGGGGASPAPYCDPDMALIPGGTTTLGDPQNADKAGDVTLPAFCIERTEVTVEAYDACVASKNCKPASTGTYCNAGIANRKKHPINCVTWLQAQAYCQAQGRRLSTEEEWEYAARGTDGRLYPWGNPAPDSQLCWNRFGNQKPNSSCEVQSYPTGASPFGVQDMAGNVAELTASKMSEQSAQRVGRGGTWGSSDPLQVRAAKRTGYDEGAWHGDLGFRCAASPKP